MWSCYKKWRKDLWLSPIFKSNRWFGFMGTNQNNLLGCNVLRGQIVSSRAFKSLFWSQLNLTLCHHMSFFDIWCYIFWYLNRWSQLTIAPHCQHWSQSLIQAHMCCRDSDKGEQCEVEWDFQLCTASELRSETASVISLDTSIWGYVGWQLQGNWSPGANIALKWFCWAPIPSKSQSIVTLDPGVGGNHAGSVMED